MLQVHERLGDFEIVRLLGKGGMGEVYEAIQFNPERRVALKVLASWLAHDEEALQRFWREAKVPANLDHPGIVRIISTGKSPDGVAFYAMHLVRGISLADMIRRANTAAGSDLATRSLNTANTPSAAAPSASDSEAPAFVVATGDSIPPFIHDYRHDCFTSVTRVGVQAARALAYAHEQGFLHRDIKPSNLMVDVHNQVYLVDFGLTRALQPNDDVTQPGTVIGTPWYMSPEQANGKTLDARSDIYSLGVTLFDLATFGLGPFTANRDHKSSVLAQVRAGQTLPLRLLAPAIPPALEQVILRAMQHKPARRYPSAAEMAGDLEALLGHSTKSRPRSTQRPARRWRRRGLTAGLGVCFVMAMALVVASHLRGPGDDAELDPKTSGVAEPTDPPRLDGRAAMPAFLRNAELRFEMPVINNNQEPAWGEIVFGKGAWRPRMGITEITSPQGASRTLLALADPDRPCFEFTVELNQIQSFNKDIDHDLGVFFGWQRHWDGTGEAPRYFVIELDERPREKGAQPRVVIGTALALAAKDGRAETVESLKRLPENKAIVPLTQIEIWHTIKVHVQHERVVVIVDHAVTEFSLPWLMKLDRHAATNLRTSGTLGVWSQNGVGFFKKATLAALPSN